MKIVKQYISAFILLTVCSAYSQDGILTPFTDNSEVAKIGDDPVTEYQVFGYPASVRDRKIMSYADRSKIIEDYIYELLLQKESNIPSVLNTGEYKKNYEALLKKNSAMKLKDDLIKNNFLSPDRIESYRVKNKEKIGKLKISGNDAELRELIKKEKYQEIRSYLDKYIDSLILCNNVIYNEDVFTRISSIESKSPEKLIEKIKKSMPNEILVTWNEEIVRSKELLDRMKDVKPWRMKDLSNPKILKRLVDGSIINSILSSEAEKKGYFNREDVIKETQDQMKYLASRIYRDMIYSDGNFIPTKEEMIDYYIENKDDRTLWSRRKMWVFEIFKEYNNEDDIQENDKINVAIELENIRQKILSGEEFEKYAKFYPRPYSKDGELGFIFEDDHAMVGKTASKMNAGDISDLIIQKKAISIIKVTQVQEPMLYKFDYVEDIVKRALISIKKEKFMETHKNELFSKYDVKLTNN
ncbi:MAG: peptidylprolyl isomerase [Candidatus Delongbacteria bacterium]|nr:peptidylprolyl isomerase [Candidatus Delongbacteria bacterium]